MKSYMHPFKYELQTVVLYPEETVTDEEKQKPYESSIKEEKRQRRLCCLHFILILSQLDLFLRLVCLSQQLVTRGERERWAELRRDRREGERAKESRENKVRQGKKQEQHRRSSFS